MTAIEVNKDAALQQRLFMFVNNTDWPTRTHRLCDYDLHSFDTFPIGVPVSFDQRTNRYVLAHMFCSLSCAKAWILCGQNNSPHYRARIDLVDKFFRCVWNIRLCDVDEPAPLEQLSKLREEKALAGNANADAEAIEAWRHADSKYRNLRKVTNLFMCAGQVYEQQISKTRTRIRQDMRAEMMVTQEPKPVMLTEHGRRQQMKLVRERVEQQQNEQSTTLIDNLLGIQLRKKIKK